MATKGDESPQPNPQPRNQSTPQPSIMAGSQLQLGSPRKPLDIQGAIARYARIIIFFATLAFIGMLPAAFMASSPYYLATGSILVERVRDPVIASTEQRPISNFFYDYAQTEVHRLGNVNILRKTLEALPEPARAQFAPAGINAAAILALRQSLTIGLIPNTHLIMVQLRTHLPYYTAELVNTLMQTYIHHAAHVAENRDARRLNYLHDERNDLQLQVKKLTERLMTLASQTRTATFVEAYNVDSLRLIELQKAWVAACREMVSSKNLLTAAEHKAEALRALPTEALSDELVAGDESLWSISYWTYKTLQELRASIDGVSKSNPDRQYIETRMKAMKAYEAQLKETVTKRAKRIVHDKREYELNKEVLTAAALATAAKKTDDELVLALQSQQAVAAENSRRIIEGQIVEATLAQVRDRLYAVETRLQELRAESKSPVRASIEEYAQSNQSNSEDDELSETGKKDSMPQAAGTNTKKLIMLCVVAAFGGVGFLFLALEVLDGRIRSTRDIMAATEHAPSWPIPIWQGTSPFWRVTADAPQALASCALRSLAVRLHKEHSRTMPVPSQGERRDALLTVITGIESRVGTSSVAVNVARSLAGLGAKVLYAEAIFMGSKEQGEAHGAQSNLDFASQRSDEAHSSGPQMCTLQGALPTDCIMKAEEPFDIIAIGSDWGHGQDGQLAAVLEALRSQYDFIIMDSSPLCHSDLTEYMLLEAHVAILVAQAGRTDYVHLRKTLEILCRLRVPAMTTVFNWGGPLYFNQAERLLRHLPNMLLRFTMPHLLQKDVSLDEAVRPHSMWPEAKA